MCDLLPRVTAYVRQHSLLRDGAALVVGVSGGPDSVCLLHLLTRLVADVPGLRLHVAHLNHQLRGADADADAAFVAALAASSGLPCTVGRADVAALAARAGLSLEEAARQARYAFLSDVARAAAADMLTVGHNADDQAETVLMHFLRGSGVAGLRGMLPVTELGEYRLDSVEHPEQGGAQSKGTAHPSTGRSPRTELSRPPAQDAAARRRSPVVHPLRLIRPLLGIPRADILAYCAAQGLAYRFDRSNEDTTLFRNRLRHELLPLLESYNPAIRDVLTHTAAVMAGDYEVLAAELGRAWAEVSPGDYKSRRPLRSLPSQANAESAEADFVTVDAVSTAEPAEPAEIQFDLAAWRGLPVGLQRGLVREAVHRLRRSLRNINWEHVERAVQLGRGGRPGQAATLAAGLELQVSADRLRIAAEGTLPPAGLDVPQIATAYTLAAPGVTDLPGGWQVVVSRLDAASLPPDFAVNADPWRAWLDAAATGPVLALRPRIAGDRLQPQGMAGHAVRLNELMINLKVPRAARPGWPILVGQAGIAWACGLRLDARAAVTAQTAAVWQVEFTKEAPAT